MSSFDVAVKWIHCRLINKSTHAVCSKTYKKDATILFLLDRQGNTGLSITDCTT